MRRWQRVADAIDRLSEAVGRLASWLTLLMVLLGAFNALARYAGRWMGQSLASNAYIEAQWYLFSLVFLLGAAYTLRHNAHVRVDVLYARLSRRGRAWINLLGTLLFLLPFSLLTIFVSWPSIRSSWAVLERSPDPGGLARYPIKSVILVAFGLLLLQGIALVIRQVAILRGVEAVPDEEPVMREGV